MSDPEQVIRDAASRLSMSVGEAMFTQRAIRRLRPEPIPMDDVKLILEAATKAPSGGNEQWARFLAVDDRAQLEAFGVLYKEAWWAKRKAQFGWNGPEDVPEGETQYVGAMKLANEIGKAPLIIFVLSQPPGPANSVVTCAQNLMLAGRALGYGSVPTTLHPTVMERFHAMFNIPPEIGFHFCIPMGKPRGNFGPTTRRPAGEVGHHNQWGSPLPWAEGTPS